MSFALRAEAVVLFSLGHVGHCDSVGLTWGGSSSPDPALRRGTVRLVQMSLPLTLGPRRLVPPDGHVQETLEKGAFLTAVRYTD